MAQPQFWRQKLGEWSGYRGILSVDVGNWHRPSSKTRRCASESTRDEIGREVWRQIRRRFPSPADVPEPTWFWIDDHLVFHASGSGRGGVKENELTFVINPPGTYADRPGIFDHQPGERDRLGGEPDAPRRYRLGCGDRLVYAGSWVRTHTRLNSMEAANESARLAVNGILRAEDQRNRGARAYEPCMVVDPEEHELQGPAVSGRARRAPDGGGASAPARHPRPGSAAGPDRGAPARPVRQEVAYAER